MQQILDFIGFLWNGISTAAYFTARLIGLIPNIYRGLFDLLQDIPAWFTLPILATVVTAVVLQIVSFIPTESGGNS